MVRLALFRDSGYKMLLEGGEVANVEKKGHNAGRLRHGPVGTSGRPGGSSGPGQFQGYNGFIPQNLEARAMSALSRFGDNAKMASDTMWMTQFQTSSETAGSKHAVFLQYNCHVTSPVSPDSLTL